RHPSRSTLFPYTTLFRSYTESDQGQYFGTIYFYPIKANAQNDVTVLKSGRLEVEIIPGRPRIRTRNTGFTTKSVLSEGRILKIRSEEHTSELQSRENLVC